MPKQAFALERDGPKRLEVSWKGRWKDVAIQLDGETIGTIPGQKELSAGQEFQLPDGSILTVQLIKKLTAVELQLLRDGQPLPGSATDPETMLKGAYVILFFIAGLNIVLGSIAYLFQAETLQRMGMGFYSIIFGVVFLVLGRFVRRRSLAALVIAIVIFVLDSILSFVLAGSQGYTSNVVEMVARAFLLLPMIQGIGAIRAIKEQ